MAYYESNNQITKYDDGALDTEIVEEASVLDKNINSLTQNINRNKEILDEGLKASEDELKQLVNIQNNINLANQKKQELLGMHYQNYINDTAYQNYIISSHNNSIQYAMQRGIQFWKSYDNSNIYYRVNAFSKQKKLNVEKDLFSLLNAQIKIYDSIEEVQFPNNNTLILIASYLSVVKDDIFDPNNIIEWLTFNNMKYKNTFKYTSFLGKRILLRQKQQLEQQLQSQSYQHAHHVPQMMNVAPALEPQLLPVFDSVKDELMLFSSLPQDRLQELSQQLEIRNSVIQDFIVHIFKDEYQFNFIMNWLVYFFQNLNKTSRAIVLIGDKETIDILIHNILKPIFAYKKEYFCVINNETLKKSNDTILKDRIFYHVDTDNLTKENIKNLQLSKLVKELIKPNNLDYIQANENYIHGETIVTSSSENPYPFLKNNYSRCSVFKVQHINTILKQFDMDQLELEEKIQNDLHNFSNILVQYRADSYYSIIAQTDERNALPKMKKGILLTPILERQIQQFISAIKEKNKQYFRPLELENDKSLYKELVENFDDDAIYQPLLNEYFNIIYEDITFLDNSDFIDILKEMECLFSQAPDDKFKINGQRRYKLYEYKLAKNYKGNCQDTMI